MAFNIPINTVHHRGISIRGTSVATIVYVLISDGAEVLIGRRPLAFNVALEEGAMIPGPQDLANLIGTDCQARFGGRPDAVIIEGTTYTPAS